MKTSKTFTTQYFDLDWNRHVTSRTYERFAYSSRIDILNEIGYPIHKILEQGFKWISKASKVRFLSQQFAGAHLTVITETYRDKLGNLHFIQKIQDENSKPVCNLQNISILVDAEGKVIHLLDIPEHQEESHPVHIHLNDRQMEWNCLQHKIYIPFSDMTCFWNLSTEAIWKIFEEGRFLFFKEVVDLNFIHQTDTTTFFMGGEIEILTLPEPGSNVQLLSWIDVVDKIRFYFRQDVLDHSGNLLARMVDEQVFVALSTSRPRRAPVEFLERTSRFTRPQ